MSEQNTQNAIADWVGAALSRACTAGGVIEKHYWDLHLHLKNTKQNQPKHSKIQSSMPISIGCIDRGQKVTNLLTVKHREFCVSVFSFILSFSFLFLLLFLFDLCYMLYIPRWLQSFYCLGLLNQVIWVHAVKL